MHGEEAEIPDVPRWFAGEVLALFALYPNATTSQATVPAWWRLLHALPRDAVLEGFRRALEGSTTYLPTAVAVRDHARSAAKSGFGSSHPDFARAALPEPEPELPEENPMWSELESIKQRVRLGELRGAEAMRAVVRAVADKL